MTNPSPDKVPLLDHCEIVRGFEYESDTGWQPTVTVKFPHTRNDSADESWTRRDELAEFLSRVPAVTQAQGAEESVVVPRVPTREMHAAAMDALGKNLPWTIGDIYAAMLGAAPTPPSPDANQDDARDALPKGLAADLKDARRWQALRYSVVIEGSAGFLQSMGALRYDPTKEGFDAIGDTAIQSEPKP